MITRFDIPDIDQKNVYLTRWSIKLPFGWSLKLHHIRRPDDDRCQHDHPWWFWTLVLRGGYVELIGEEQREERRRVGSLSYRPVDFRHRITELPRGSAWTLVLSGPRSREWGFFTKSGWMHWKAFVDAARSARVLWCHDGSVRVSAQEKEASDG